MKRILLILAVVASCSANAFARWAWIPLEDLVQDSDVIVIGTLQEVSQYTHNGMDYAQGNIVIEEVIWGTANPGEVFTLKWQNASGLVCPRVEHRHNKDNKGIWLLTVDPDGVVRANYPGRFVELNERSKVEQCLAKNLLSLRMSQFLHVADEPINVSLVFRNPTERFIEFPGVEYRDGHLLIAPGVSLNLYAGYEKSRIQQAPLPGRVIRSNELSPIVVAPRQEFRLSLDLRTLFPVSYDEQYSLRLNIKGFGRANDIWIYNTLEAPQRITDGDAVVQVLQTRPGISRLTLLMPSLLAIVVSSIFVYRHAKEMIHTV